MPKRVPAGMEAVTGCKRVSGSLPAADSEPPIQEEWPCISIPKSSKMMETPWFATKGGGGGSSFIILPLTDTTPSSIPSSLNLQVLEIWPEA
eukprot:scaffold725_cov162-Ochromonas_danica.AAC.15